MSKKIDSFVWQNSQFMYLTRFTHQIKKLKFPVDTCAIIVLLFRDTLSVSVVCFY